MPTYDYDCSSCGRTTEIFQSITAPPVEKCPHCGGKVSRRISGGTGLIFKGSGFYLTDYKNAGTKNGDGKAEKAKPAAGAAEAPGKEKSGGEAAGKKAESPPASSE
ncbi:MAG: hypothetical protein DKINENOH_00180 [bacterium]|nr:hypothetical protein [bacterium]